MFIFSPLNYINVSPPNFYILFLPNYFMKLLKVKSRTYNGKPYYKYRVNLPEELLEKSGFKEGDELVPEAKKGEIRLKKG